MACDLVDDNFKPLFTRELRADALSIWQSGVQAVNAQRVTQAAVQVTKSGWKLGSVIVPPTFGRVAVVGGGKAADGMVRGFCRACERTKIEIFGWVNVPDQLAGHVGQVRLHAGRPWGVNEPTEAAVAGTREMLKLVRSLTTQDLCVCLLTGGGSALVTAPPEGVTLAEKIWLLQKLVAAGASIQEINAVRRCLSDVKGGGVARACRAPMVALLVSDVLGDDPAAIASGPAVVGSRDPVLAEQVIRRYVTDQHDAMVSIHRAIEGVKRQLPDTHSPVPHCILANLNAAMAAAAEQATRLGYSVTLEPITCPQPDANQAGRLMASQLLQPKTSQGRMCSISGGEPTVELVAVQRRGRGGRNQQLVLAALDELLSRRQLGTTGTQHHLPQFAVLSAGTDGEDGPTDAAGAVLDAELLDSVETQNLDPRRFLEMNDAYSFFQRTGGLIQTGWTGTNVCDLRVLLRVEP